MEYSIVQHISKRLVRSEHLNHHGTLYAGKGAEWFVESGFIAASDAISPKNLICKQIDSLSFRRPVRCGEIICYNSRIIYVGKTSIVVYVKVVGKLNNLPCTDIIVDGFAVFVHVDENTKPKNHNITLITSSNEDNDILNRYLKK